MNKILVYGDDVTRLKNLTAYGRRLAKETGAILVTALIRPAAEQMASQAASFGADVVLVIDVPENAYFAETIVENLFAVYTDEQPDAIFISSTFLGREIAPRLATKLRTGCITECSKVEMDENGQLVAERLVYGGIAASRMAITKTPQVFTVTFDTDISITLEDKSNPEIIKRENIAGKVAKRITGKAKIEKSIDLAGADNIVSVGRGFNSEKDIELMKPLLEQLNAELGCSRPIAEDFRWLPAERLVGLTGTVVKPKLYLAIGISGQIQHQVGMKNSKLIIAINNNPQAPIFEIADYGVVGDLYEVIPKLTERIANR